MSVTGSALRAILSRIDGRGYPAYKDIRGSYRHELFTLHVDHVQRDPFASPSRLRLSVPRSTAQFPPHTESTRTRAIAFRDFLARRFARECRAAQPRAPTVNIGPQTRRRGSSPDPA